MKAVSSTPLILSLVLSGGMAHGGTVKINQQIFPLFEVSAPGVEGLEHPTIATGSYKLESHVGFPVSTEVTLNPILDGMHNYPIGRVSWKHEQKKDNYTFFISAGGHTDRATDMNSYCVFVEVNFKPLGSKCTSGGGFWDPLVINNVIFPANSNITITIKPRW